MDEKQVNHAPVTVLLGMHRSGTSALVNLLSDLGLCGPSDPLPAAPDNPDGYGESLQVITTNNAILDRHCGQWDAPPNGVPLVGDDVVQLNAALLRAYGTNTEAPAVLKDPRLCLLIPTLRAALGGEHLKAIVVFRHLDRVLPSLLHENRGVSQLHSSLHAAALWERYNRQLFDNLTDDDELLICDFDALLNRDDYRSRWLDLLTAFLPRELGQNRTTVDAAFSNRFSLSTKSGATSESVATPQQLALYRELVEMAQHNAVRPLDGSETPGHDALFHSIYAASVTLPQLEQQLETTARSLEEQTQARHYLEGYSANQQRRIEALDEQIASMEQSLSWRVTTPLRKLQQRRPSRS